MSAASDSTPERRPAKPRTLGELLFTGTSGEPPEREWVKLVRAIAAGDPVALRDLHDRTHRIVFTLIMRITHDRHSAEELTVDVFHDVWRRAATYDEARGSVVAWVMNQARSRAIDRVRFEHRSKRSGHPTSAERASGDDAGALTLELHEQTARLQAALHQLTADERQAVEAAYFGELSYREVAARLDTPLGTIKTRIRSALSKLRHALGEREEGR